MEAPYMPYVPPQKGTLPVPRELFPLNRPDKGNQRYIENVAKERLPANVRPLESLTEVGRHKAKMAEIRKAQFKEGVTGLHKRKQAEIASINAKSTAKILQRDTLLKQSEREDARLMNVSIPALLQPESQPSIDALKEQVALARQMHERKMANVSKHQAAKKNNKMDALHTLYMNARHFITSEEQLREKIHEQFDVSDAQNSDTTSHAQFRTLESSGSSLWNFGAPDGIRDMVASASGRNRDASLAAANPAMRYMANLNVGAATMMKDQARMKKIAEKLSGGKI
ncbi:hypothetical protein LTR05_006612 [Lithohypha guttulata]|uniref:Uncharacterized protein n=1 Tax=Lithohypha guttulata TaxID=1690604 RepID=A0AAN7Y4L5_9EURO|nr:hypothetical protein LTR05_006612 [Lithohypha guttulata]